MIPAHLHGRSGAEDELTSMVFSMLLTLPTKIGPWPMADGCYAARSGGETFQGRADDDLPTHLPEPVLCAAAWHGRRLQVRIRSSADPIGRQRLGYVTDLDLGEEMPIYFDGSWRFVGGVRPRGTTITAARVAP